ncbi:MAG: hypothetical protein ABIO40_10590 [Devosia sp.]
MASRDPAIARTIRIKAFLITFGLIAVTILVGVGAGTFIARNADRQTIEAIINK